jgi:predicted XRE-type DNA-binding protein
MSPPDKPLVWKHGEIATPPFSENARVEAGYLLRQVQKGVKLSLPQSRPMPSIGTRCHELRIKVKNNMDTQKKKVLESKGYKVGTVEEFLGLSSEESEYIELKLALSEALIKRRKKSKLTQSQLAKMLKSSQSRVAKMEKGDPTVSIDLLVKSLLALGADKKSIARAIA